MVILKCGKFGTYFFDEFLNKDLDNEEVLRRLNEKPKIDPRLIEVHGRVESILALGNLVLAGTAELIWNVLDKVIKEQK